MSDDAPPIPDGYRPTASGLIVPDGLSRIRETWTDDEVKILERATRYANARGWYLALTCPDIRCGAVGKPVVERVEVAGGFELQCQHKTVVCVGLKYGSAKQRRRAS